MSQAAYERVAHRLTASAVRSEVSGTLDAFEVTDVWQVAKRPQSRVSAVRCSEYPTARWPIRAP